MATVKQYFQSTAEQEYGYYEVCFSTTCAQQDSKIIIDVQRYQTHTRGSAIAEEPRDALRQLKYYGRFLTELLTRSSANPEEPCEHTVS